MNATAPATASDAQVCEALAAVLRPDPAGEAHFGVVYASVREHLALHHGRSVALGRVKALLRASGVVVRHPPGTLDQQVAYGVALIIHPPMRTGQQSDAERLDKLSASWQRESLFDEQGLLRVWGMTATV